MITVLKPTRAEEVNSSNLKTLQFTAIPKAPNLVLIKLGEEQSTIIANTRQDVYNALNSKNNYIKGVALLEVADNEIKQVDIATYYECYVFPALQQQKRLKGTLNLAEVM